jgi:hypothetical protein
MSGAFSMTLIREALRGAPTVPLPSVYCGAIARFIRQTFNNARAGTVDQHQSSALYCVHQLRVRLPGDPVQYRVLIAPEDAPVAIGGVPVDEHFAEPITP